MSPKTEHSPWRPHPWHGLPAGPEPPRRVTAYIELTPHDPVKYAVDEASGYLRLDRRQRASAPPPSLYGFVPRTARGRRVARLAKGAESGGALGVFVLCERPVTRSEILVDARVVGGLPMLEGGKAADRLIAVFEGDGVWGQIADIGGVPRALLDRIVHYFATSEFLPDSRGQVTVGEPYGRERAERVVQASMEDYQELFGQAEHAA